jgi:hypothetical protein
MPTDENYTITSRINRIRHLTGDENGTVQWLEAASLAQSVLHDTIGGAHPLMATLDNALKSKDGTSAALAASRALVTLYEEGALKSPRLAIAGEIEGDILDIAQAQVQAAEIGTDANRKQLQLAIAAFLTGAALEDALRRLSDAHGIQYDAQKTSISKLQTVLFQPSKQVEVISRSENKQITVWGDTRNKADHGKFEDITCTEVVSMVLGVRAFIERHLP